MLAIHWRAMLTWFYLDDFAWLGLQFEIHSPRDILRVLFRPEAQGTVRFLTAAASVGLVSLIGRWLGKTNLAGLFTGVFWIASDIAVILSPNNSSDSKWTRARILTLEPQVQLAGSVAKFSSCR